MRVLQNIFTKGLKALGRTFPPRLLILTPCKLNYCKTNTNETEVNEFKAIYKLPAITVATTINRLKRDLTFLTCIGLPASFVCWQLSIIPHEISFFSGLCGLGCLSLHTLGLLCNRVIGAMYISSDSSLVKISYCDYWGSRKDFVCPVSDVVPLSELQENVGDPYVSFRRYSVPETLRLVIKFGLILDPDGIVIVLGKLDSS